MRDPAQSGSGSQQPGDIFRSDFSSLANWTLSNSRSGAGEPLWHPTTSREYSDEGGSHIWYGVPGSTGYNAPDNGTHHGTATSPTIDLTTIANDQSVNFSFNYLLHTDEIDGRDIAEVMVSTDGGATFTRLTNGYNRRRLASDPLYTGYSVDESGILQDPTTSTPSNPWRRAEFDLTPWIGQEIQLQFSFDTVSGGLNQFSGWHIDDVAIQTESVGQLISISRQQLPDSRFVDGLLTVQSGDFDDDGRIDLAVGESSRRIFLQVGSIEYTLDTDNQGWLTVFSDIVSHDRRLELDDVNDYDYQLIGEGPDDLFGVLGGSIAGDFDGDRKDNLVVGAALADSDGSDINTGKVYLIGDGRAPLSESELPANPTILSFSPIADVVERSGDGSILQLEDVLPETGDQVRWFRFTTVGDGQLGDFVRVIHVNDVSGEPLTLTLFTQDGRFVTTGVQPLISLDRVERGTYLLRVEVRDGFELQLPASFSLEIAPPSRYFQIEPIARDRDVIEGGDGADYLSGGPGLDRLLGGDGIDTFSAESFEVFDAMAGESVFDVTPGSEAAADRSPLADQEVDIADAGLLAGIVAELETSTRPDGQPFSPLTKQDLARLSELTITPDQWRTSFFDINPGIGNSFPDHLLLVNEQMFFTANDGTSGTELWSVNIDGTGLTRLTDITPGGAGSIYSDLTLVNGRLFFQGSDGTSGAELWSINVDGTGLTQVADIYPGSSSSLPSEFTHFDGRLFFHANDGTSGNELWSVNGDGTGLTQVADINPGSSSSFPALLTLVNERLFFVANDGASGQELWSVDVDGTELVQVTDINPGSGSSSVGALTLANDRLFFRETMAPAVMNPGRLTLTVPALLKLGMFTREVEAPIHL